MAEILVGLVYGILRAVPLVYDFVTIVPYCTNDYFQVTWQYK